MSSEEGGAEAYCVDSGAPVRLGAGDRCIHHGAADTPCFTAVRAVPKCTHSRWPKGANSSDTCPECGHTMTPEGKP